MILILVAAFLIYHEKIDTDLGGCLMIFGFFELVCELLIIAGFLSS